MPHGGQHPTEETMNITRKFLGGELGTPGQAPGSQQPAPQAAPIAGQRAFGQRGSAVRRPRPGVRQPILRQPLSASASLSDRFFNLPGPVDFSRTPQGQGIMQRILANRRGFR